MSVWRIIVCLGLLAPMPVLAQMTSTNYSIFADSIGLNGGEASTSTNFTLSDTISDTPGNVATSTSYYVYGGFQGAELAESLSVSFSTNNLALGELAADAVAEASTTVSVSTNAITGYTLTISDASGSMPTAVSDGTVTAGSEEYGVAVTGNHAAFADDRSVVNGRVLASYPHASATATTTVYFRASKAAGSTAGSYAQTVTVTASANF